MKKILTALFLGLFLSSNILAGENFSEMSTQELIAIIGYVKKSDVEKFETEIKARVASMNPSELAKYKENLKKSTK